MSLEKLREKYDPLIAKVEDRPPLESQSGAINSGSRLPAAPKVEERIRLQSWKDSTPVVHLSEYLKQHKDQGIKLYRKYDGRPYLYFEPGLCRTDMKTGCWQIAADAVRLLEDAADDLKYLIANNLINISLRLENAAGPSPASE
jgi:hypothetical protein